ARRGGRLRSSGPRAPPGRPAAPACGTRRGRPRRTGRRRGRAAGAGIRRGPWRRRGPGRRWPAPSAWRAGEPRRPAWPPASRRRRTVRLAPGLAAGVDPTAQLLGLGASVGADAVELGQHLLGAGHIAPLDLQLTTILGGAAMIGGQGQGLLIE